MAKKTRIKAKLKKGIITVKAMAKHAMLGHREAKKAKKELNFITYMTATVNDKLVYEVSTSQFLSKNPYIKFKFRGADKGDKVIITWVDLTGVTQVSTGKIK